MIVFLDDILVYNPHLESHLTHFVEVFTCLAKEQFYLKQSNYLFTQESVGYLRLIIPSQGIAPNKSKTEVMVQWLEPKTLKQLRGFLGPRVITIVLLYASIPHPLTKPFKKDTILWTHEFQKAFDI